MSSATARLLGSPSDSYSRSAARHACAASRCSPIAEWTSTRFVNAAA
ncbi:hypothetical protein ENC19_09395 [Verrucosispora sp. CWR15]|uniref:Uncharacterized protein n=1 Tax=Verrucosispora sioxanthis TaxID=2499994 RepID=A0A6M1KUT6_9ACTN|nr:hypothetical protein [Verrucosispora sioxanthis]NEE63745.1 hypothetical protein [Verrucosispora sioxanthis]NGM12855.1 hypothetical protein [Verrucosispora sioxanthis]